MAFFSISPWVDNPAGARATARVKAILAFIVRSILPTPFVKIAMIRLDGGIICVAAR
jgi:hypothetical protein